MWFFLGGSGIFGAIFFLRLPVILKIMTAVTKKKYYSHKSEIIVTRDIFRVLWYWNEY
jgi:hypothetical protein